MKNIDKYTDEEGDPCFGMPNPTPPIHSAGEEVGAIEVIKRAYTETEKLDFSEHMMDDQYEKAFQIANEIQDILGIYLEGDHKLWKESFRQPPTLQTGRAEQDNFLVEGMLTTNTENKLKQQTGRTYTEGEVEQAAKDFAFNAYDIVDGIEVPICKNAYEGDIAVKAFKFAINNWLKYRKP